MSKAGSVRTSKRTFIDKVGLGEGKPEKNCGKEKPTYLRPT